MVKKRRNLLSLEDFCKAMAGKNNMGKIEPAPIKSVRRWIAEGMPVEADGTFDLRACQRWHLIGHWEQRQEAISTCTSRKRGRPNVVV